MNTIAPFIREDLRAMKPYSSARDEFDGTGSVWLDANEHPSLTTWNRYPDPLQWELKKEVANKKGVAVEKLFLGNGSDEVLDLLFRLIARPFSGKVAFFDPSYGMYEVLARLNGLEQVRIPLHGDFTPDWELTQTLMQGTQVMVVCRPNNPTGNVVDRHALLQLLRTYKGVMIVDEAYVDFCPEISLAAYTEQFPNLIVVQTLSKAYGMAGLRIGMAIANREWIAALNTIKPPYNISAVAQQQAIALLQQTDVTAAVAMLNTERQRMIAFLTEQPLVREVFPSSANFILFRVEDAAAVYRFLTQRGIIVRNRNNQYGCANCLRVTVGSVEENNAFMNALTVYQS